MNNSDNPINLIEALKDFLHYLYIRIRQIFIWISLIGEFHLIFFSNLKREVVKRMFWGRNSFYRKFFHIAILSITVLILFNGISQRIQTSRTQTNGLNIAEGNIGQNDIFLQYSNTKAFTLKAPDELAFSVVTHEVVEGETLSGIAKQYGLSNSDSIKWSNKLDPYNPVIKPGQKLKIPPMDGVFKIAKKGDTPETIIKDIEKAEIYDVLDLNEGITSIDQVISEGIMIFIPNGEIKLPPPKGRAGNSPAYVDLEQIKLNVPPGTFVNPLLDAGCKGYTYSRGWSTWHTGLDLAKKNGCWINSIADGIVERARWCEGGLGFCVLVKHSNGYSSLYAHGNGTFSVKEGQNVTAGQKIMFMGNTGNSFGTHLHLSMAVNNMDVIDYNSRINVKGIVPY